MISGLNYEEAKTSKEYYKYLESNLTIFEEFYKYLSSNEYENICVQDFSIHGKKRGHTVQLFFDASKYDEYVLRVWDKYSLIFRYEYDKYKLYRMDEDKEFENITQIIEYFNSLSDIKI